MGKGILRLFPITSFYKEMNILTEKINTDIKYNRSDNKEIVSQIVKNFDGWDDDRQAQLGLIEKIQDLLDVMDSIADNSDLKDADVRELLNSFTAHHYNSTFKTPSQMFSVELETESSASDKMTFAYIQKAAILNILKKSRAKKQFKKAMLNWGKKGEIILYVNWTQIWQNVRRKTGFKYEPLGIDLQKWEVSRQLKYDGATIKCIEPEHFVFDTTRADDFENAPKIYKSWQTYTQIANNDYYNQFLKKKDLEELKEAVKSEDKDLFYDVKDLDFDTNKGYKDNMIEVLQYEGDITIEKDGKSIYYPNMKIVTVGRAFVACFKYNPNIISSYIYCAYEVDDDTGRGIPMLGSIIPYADFTVDLLNKIKKAIGLSINKCWLVPKGSLEGEQKVKENGVIEYNDSFDINKVKELDFQSALQHGLNILQFIEGKKEQSTGRFKSSTGDPNVKAKTLGEAKMIKGGEDALQSFERDILSNEVVIPLVEKIGELMANFQDQDQQIKYKDSTGKEYTAIMDDTIRQENYVYIVNDTQTAMDKKVNMSDYVEAVMGQIAPYAAQTGQGMININELITILGSAYDQEDPSKILVQQQPAPQLPGQPQGAGNGVIPPEVTGGGAAIPALPNAGL